jgi:uncharacterized oxidoreductase
MKNNSNTILITGGATGIGLALAVRFLNKGNDVIICGRRQEKLDEAKRKHPGLHTCRCDVSQESERVRLFDTIVRDFPKLNVLLNNAGISGFHKLDMAASWPEERNMIATNLEGTIHLSQLFASHLSKQDTPAIFVTTSGLAHVPRANFPIYCATKAALHSFALSLRHQLKALKIEVIEICPPHVDTDLGAPGRNKAGIPVDEFADGVMTDLEKGTLEITYGTSTKWVNASRVEKDEMFRMLNQ